MDSEEDEEEVKPVEPVPPGMTFLTFTEGMNAHLGRGSPLATVKAYIATAHEHAEAFESAHAALAAKNAELMAENADLRAQNAELQRLNFELTVKDAKPPLDAGHKAILKAIFDAVERKPDAQPDTQEIADATGQGEQDALLLLMELQVDGYVSGRELEFSDGRILWGLQPKGARWNYDRRRNA